MRDEQAQMVAELVRELDVVGVKSRVVAVVGTSPVLAIRIHTVGDRGERVAEGILGISTRGDGGRGGDGVDLLRFSS